MPMKRICMVPTDTENYDSGYNITVDAFLTEEGVPTDRMTAFGARGGIAKNSENIEPFLLFKDGSLDFGTDWDVEDRDFHLNMRGQGRAIREGELFTFTGPGEEIIYRVKQMVDLQ